MGVKFFFGWMYDTRMVVF
jgi:hypothetical protein